MGVGFLIGVRHQLSNTIRSFRGIHKQLVSEKVPGLFSASENKPGTFSLGDYWRMGLPLELIIVAVSVPMIMWVWPI